MASKLFISIPLIRFPFICASYFAKYVAQTNLCVRMTRKFTAHHFQLFPGDPGTDKLNFDFPFLP